MVNVNNDQNSPISVYQLVPLMPYSYCLNVRLEGGVNFSGHLSHFRFGTLLLNQKHSPLSVCRLVFASCCFYLYFSWPFPNLPHLILLKLSLTVVCNMLIAGFYVWLNLNPSWLMLFEWSHISMATFTSQPSNAAVSKNRGRKNSSTIMVSQIVRSQVKTYYSHLVNLLSDYLVETWMLQTFTIDHFCID
jgi:hypothetical protein